MCVNVYCQRVTTQLQLINIIYHIRMTLKISDGGEDRIRLAQDTDRRRSAVNSDMKLTVQ
jgi:hypothetical protein